MYVQLDMHTDRSSSTKRREQDWMQAAPMHRPVPRPLLKASLVIAPRHPAHMLQRAAAERCNFESLLSYVRVGALPRLSTRMSSAQVACHGSGTTLLNKPRPVWGRWSRTQQASM
jgi:hypothetical protein